MLDVRSPLENAVCGEVTVPASSASSVRGVSKSFGGKVVPFSRGGHTVHVFHDVSFDLHPGEIMVLRGANGSGKTTLLKIIAGLVSPDTGSIRCHGAGRVRLGFASGEERSLYWRLSARDNLRFFAALYGLPAAESDDRAKALLERLGLGGKVDTPVRSLSSGQKQRVLVARALIAQPEIVLLDEPTGRMDDEGSELVWKLLRDHAARGAAIVVTTHRDDEEARGDVTALIEDHCLVFGDQARSERRAAHQQTNLGFRGVIRVGQAFIRRDFEIARGYPLGLFMQFVNMVLGGASLFFLSQIVGPGSHLLQSYGGNYFAFALIGMIAFNIQSVPMYSFASAIRDGQLTGTLEALLATPTPFFVILVGSTLWALLLTLITTALLLVASALVFHLTLVNPLYGVAILAVVLSLVSAVGMALLDVAFVLVFKRGSPLATIFGYASNLLGGILYPIKVLPIALQAVAVLLPITHTANMLRYSLLGSNLHGALLDGVALTLLGIVCVCAGLLALRIALRIAHAQGTIGQY